MNDISAEDLKTRGIDAIESALTKQQAAAVTVNGQRRYVVMCPEEYVRLRECELQGALAESRADLEAGRFVRETIAQHLERIDELADKGLVGGPC
jgi:hypothetical protein